MVGSNKWSRVLDYNHASSCLLSYFLNRKIIEVTFSILFPADVLKSILRYSEVVNLVIIQ